MNFFQRLLTLVSCVFIIGGFAALAYVITHRETLDLRKLLYDEHKHVSQAFFSPDDNVRTLLIALIHAEKKDIKIAVYTLTDKKISQALIEARKRDITITCVVDRSYGADRYSKVAVLANAGIPIWVYQPSENERNSSLMHHKFILFKDTIDGKTLLWTGSYNFTQRANEANQENVIILDTQRIIDKFYKQFEILKKRSLLINGQWEDKSNAETNDQPDWLKKIRALF